MVSCYVLRLITTGAWAWLAHAVAEECFSQNTEYYPLDMGGQTRTTESSARACQTRCASVTGCAYFSFWSDGGCHLQGASAFAISSKAARGLTVTAGPASCATGSGSSSFSETFSGPGTGFQASFATSSSQRHPRYGITPNGESTLLSEPASVEQPLAAVLHSEANRLEEELLKSVNTSGCQERILEVANYMRHRFQRSFPRHPYAETFCPVEALVSGVTDGRLQLSMSRKPMPPLPKCKATLAFALLISRRGEMLSRLLERIIRPDHLYHFLLDHSSDQKDGIRKVLEDAVQKHGPVRWWNHSDSVDVVYGGPSLVLVFLVALRQLLQSGVPAWDFLINLSDSDYPLRSVEYMSRRLARYGAISYTEVFLLLPNYVQGRALRSWFIECPEEPCFVPSPNCKGQLLWMDSLLKPHIALSREFGGSQWWVLHYDFSKYLWECLDADGAEGWDNATQEFCRSVRGMFQWYSTSFASDETFVQTVLFNSPFCDKAQSRNLRFVSWKAGDGSCNGQQVTTRYQGTRPKCFTKSSNKQVRKSWLPPDASSYKGFEEEMRRNLEMRQDEWLIGRKFSTITPDFAAAVDFADQAIASWDALLEEGLYSCEGLRGSSEL